MALGIIGAMDVEVELLRAHLDGVRVTCVGGMEFSEGRLGGTDAIVVRCGVGSINAAMCAQTLAVRFGADRVVNTGVAGSLDARVGIGDVVVSTDAVNYDMDVQNLGYRPGQCPGMDTLAFAADPTLRQAAVCAARTVAPEAGVFEGRVASGDKFVHEDAMRRWIAEEFGALCCEMEGAAIAQACHVNGIPFAIVRTISDEANGASATDYPAFERKMALRCAAIVERMAAGLA